MIDVSNLVFEYPGHRALDDVSFHIRANSITALVGPNGAGKTTLLRCLAGLIRPLHGRIRIGETDVLENPRQAHARLGYLSDFFGLYNELPVCQCLAFFALSHRIDTALQPQVIERAAHRTGIHHLLDKKAGDLSRGQRQRLGIAQALIHDPALLILDEPASGLDPEARSELSSLMLALRDEGKTILVSSHILSELEDYCTDMLILDGGRIAGQTAVRDETPGLPFIIELAVPAEPLRATLAASPHFQLQQIEGQRIQGVLSPQQAPEAFLRWLVEQHVPVQAFYRYVPDMQGSYLASVQKHRSGVQAP